MQADPPPPRSPVAPRTGGWHAPVLLVLLGLCCGVELVLIAADQGWIGSRLWRSLAYQNGAFWAGLLYNWRPNYDAQPWLMFLTYAFLHSGIWHLAGNMMTLMFLGDIAVRRAGRGGMLLIYVVSALGGAAIFGALTNSPQPMVGASGALFGLAGAWLYWDWAGLWAGWRAQWPTLRNILGLILLNVILWITADGPLAWETHLGGFVFGWATAAGLQHWRRAGKG